MVFDIKKGGNKIARIRLRPEWITSEGSQCRQHVYVCSKIDIKYIYRSTLCGKVE